MVLSSGINLNNKNMNPDERAPVAATVEEIEAGLLDQRIDDLVTITGERTCKENEALCDVATIRLISLIQKGALDDRTDILRELAANGVPHVNIIRLQEPSIERLRFLRENEGNE